MTKSGVFRSGFLTKSGVFCASLYPNEAWWTTDSHWDTRCRTVSMQPDMRWVVGWCPGYGYVGWVDPWCTTVVRVRVGPHCSIPTVSPTVAFLDPTVAFHGLFYPGNPGKSSKFHENPGKSSKFHENVSISACRERGVSVVSKPLSPPGALRRNVLKLLEVPLFYPVSQWCKPLSKPRGF